MFERFTSRGRRVLVLAQEEARLLDHNFIGTEHLLLGLLHEGEGIAARALLELGIPLERVRPAVKAAVDDPRLPATSGSPPFTPRAEKVLEHALSEAIMLGHNYIGPEHLLLGIVKEGEGLACQVLTDMGADFSRIRQEVLMLISQINDPESPGLRPTSQPARPPVRLRTGPRCPSCGCSLEDSVAYRVLPVEPSAGGTETGVIDVTFVYCTACGKTIAQGTQEVGQLRPPMP